MESQSTGFKIFKFTLIWLIINIVMFVPYYTIMFFVIMGTAGGVPATSLKDTIIMFPFLLLISLPSIIPLIYTIITRKKHKLGIILLIISTIGTIFTMNILAPVFGIYSVSSYFEWREFSKIEAAFEEVDPSKDPDNILLFEESIDIYEPTAKWYYSQSTKDISVVRHMDVGTMASISYEKLREKNVSIKEIDKLEITNGLTLRVLDFDHESLDDKYSRRVKFKLDGGDRIYFPRYTIEEIKTYIKR